MKGDSPSPKETAASSSSPLGLDHFIVFADAQVSLTVADLVAFFEHNVLKETLERFYLEYRSHRTLSNEDFQEQVFIYPQRVYEDLFQGFERGREDDIQYEFLLFLFDTNAFALARISDMKQHIQTSVFWVGKTESASMKHMQVVLHILKTEAHIRGRSLRQSHPHHFYLTPTRYQESANLPLIASIQNLIDTLKEGTRLEDLSAYDVVTVLVAGTSLTSLRAKVTAELQRRVDFIGIDVSSQPDDDTLIVFQYDLQESVDSSQIHGRNFSYKKEEEGNQTHERGRSLGALIHMFNEKETKEVGSLVVPEESNLGLEKELETGSFLEGQRIAQDENPLFLGSMGSEILRKERYLASDFEEEQLSFPEVQEYKQKITETIQESTEEYRDNPLLTPPHFAESSWAYVPALTLVEGGFDQEEMSQEDEEPGHELQFIQYKDLSAHESLDSSSDSQSSPPPVISTSPKFHQVSYQEESSKSTQNRYGSYASSDFATLNLDSPAMTPARTSRMPSLKVSRLSSILSENEEEFDGHGIQAIPCSAGIIESMRKNSEVSLDLENPGYIAKTQCGVGCRLL